MNLITNTIDNIPIEDLKEFIGNIRTIGTFENL